MEADLFARLGRLYEGHLAELQRRYAAPIDAHGVDAVLIHSASLRKRSDYDDQYWSLRPTPHFHHWLPLSEPDCALLVEPGRRPTLLRAKITSFWEKPVRLEHDDFLGHFDVVEFTKPEEVKERLPPGKRIAFVGENRAAAAAWGIADDLAGPDELVRALDQLRVRKTAYEVACVDEANRIAAAGHRAVHERFRAGDCSELELHLAFLGATTQDDPETPYKNIVALGPNAATLHHVALEKHARRTPVESLLLDAGATFQGYCSDITRTWVRGGGATASAFAGLVGEVERMQQRLCASIVIGEKYEALHDEAHRQVADILRAVGIVKGGLTVEEMVKEGGVTRTFFPHGLGHSLGLQCHDVGCALAKPRVENPYLRNTSTIVEGQVFTVEPGIYFIDSLLADLRGKPEGASIDWPLVEALARLGGVRIEDDLHVTGGPKVARNLTRELLPVGGGPA